MKLGRVYRTHELAAMIGWDRQRMLKHLKRLDRERGGDLLVNAGTKAMPRWTVTLEALKEASPQWFRDEESIEARLEELEEHREETDTMLQAATRAIRNLKAEVVHLRDVTNALSNNMRRIVA